MLGSPEDGPFDRVLVSAGTPAVPQDLVDQLAPDGAIVLPLASRMVRLTRDGRETAPDHYQFVPLR